MSRIGRNDDYPECHIKSDRTTPVKVYDKDSGKTMTINIVNCKITGNEAEYTVKDGIVYDKNGKTLADNQIELTRYQAALIKAAAENDGQVGNTLNSYDLIGQGYATNAQKALKNAQSEYEIAKIDDNKNDIYNLEADACEAKVIYAYVTNKNGDKGRLIIDLRTDEERTRMEQPTEKKKPSLLQWLKDRLKRSEFRY